VDVAKIVTSPSISWGNYYTMGRVEQLDSKKSEVWIIDFILTHLHGKYRDWRSNEPAVHPQHPWQEYGTARTEHWRWEYDTAAMFLRGSFFGLFYAVISFFLWDYSNLIWVAPLLTGFFFQATYKIGWRAYAIWYNELFPGSETEKLKEYKDIALMWKTLPTLLVKLVKPIPWLTKHYTTPGLNQEPIDLSELLWGPVLVTIIGVLSRLAAH
jgi:hypothetical protein